MSASSKLPTEQIDLHVTYANGGRTELEWNIRDFYDLPAREAYCVDSPPFWLCGEEYRIRITPRFEDHVCLCFVTKPSDSRTVVDLIAGLKKADGSVEDVGTANFQFQEGVALRGCYLLPRSEIETAKFKDDFAPEGTLTLVCHVLADHADEGAVVEELSDEEEVEPEIACFTHLSTGFCTLRMLDESDSDGEEKEQKENQPTGKESLERSDNINQERKRTRRKNPVRKKKRKRL